MEAARKRAIGARIKDARERSKWRQPQIADHLGIGLRAYQKMEQRGTANEITLTGEVVCGEGAERIERLKESIGSPP